MIAAGSRNTQGTDRMRSGQRARRPLRRRALGRSEVRTRKSCVSCRSRISFLTPGSARPGASGYIPGQVSANVDAGSAYESGKGPQ